jgi:alanine-glyoxylate transaminase/serine-glyoxylate transaminase/serine-pyruvate transaminase
MLMGTLAGVELGLRASGVPHQAGGLPAAMEVLCRPAAEVRAARAAHG